MPTNPTYPGVYIEEVPSGSRAIVGVSTSRTAFLGRARKGPVNEPVSIKNFGDFERAFGGLWEHSTMGYAVHQYFQNGGTDAIIVRLANPRASADGAIPGAAAAAARLPTAFQSLALRARPGQFGRGNDLRVTVTPSDADPSLSDVRVTGRNDAGEAVTETYTGLSLEEDADAAPASVLKAALAGSSLVEVAADLTGARLVPVNQAPLSGGAETPPDLVLRAGNAAVLSLKAAPGVARSGAKLKATVGGVANGPFNLTLVKTQPEGAEVEATRETYSNLANAQAAATELALRSKLVTVPSNAAPTPNARPDNGETIVIDRSEAVPTLVLQGGDPAEDALAVQARPGKAVGAVTIQVTVEEGQAPDTFDLRVVQLSGGNEVAATLESYPGLATVQAAATALAQSKLLSLPAGAISQGMGTEPLVPVEAELVGGPPTAPSALLRGSGGADVLLVAARPGAAGGEAQVRVTVSGNANDPFTVTVAQLRNGTVVPGTQVAYAGFATAAQAADRINGVTGPASSLIVVPAGGVRDGAGRPANGDTTLRDGAETLATGPLLTDKPTQGAEFLSLVAVDVGQWGNRLRAGVDHLTKSGAAADFNLHVEQLDPDGAVVAFESHHNLTLEGGKPRSVQKVLEQESRLVRLASGAPLPATHPAAAFGQSFAGGLDGPPLEAHHYIGSATEPRSGIHSLDKEDQFNLLCVPPPTREADTDLAVWEAALAYCKKRRAFLIVDPPRGWGTKEKALAGIMNGMSALRDPNAALYFPLARMPDPLQENRLEAFVPCGAVAGVYARTDAARGVWKAPAGQEANLVGARELTVKLTDPEQGDLNPLGVNCLRSFPATGRVIWGARTLRGADALASEWKYVPVRRLALYIEETLFRNTQWVVFEPNDEPLWAQIRLSVGAFMHDLFRKGAFQGGAAKDAYFVKCDAETNPPEDVDRGIVSILVGFAPLKPAEFVIVKISQIAKKGGA